MSLMHSLHKERITFQYTCCYYCELVSVAKLCNHKKLVNYTIGTNTAFLLACTRGCRPLVITGPEQLIDIAVVIIGTSLLVETLVPGAQ